MRQQAQFAAFAWTLACAALASAQTPKNNADPRAGAPSPPVSAFPPVSATATTTTPAANGDAATPTAPPAAESSAPPAPSPGAMPPAPPAPAGAAPGGPPPPGYYYAPYPYYYPPPPTAGDAAPQKRHSKFYMSLSIGPGLFRAHNSATVDERHFSGGATAVQLFLGGRIGSVVAVGGGYIHEQIFALSSKDDLLNGNEPDLGNTTVSTDSLVFFQDLSVPSTPGLHFPLYVGFSVLTEHAATSRSSDPTVFLFGGGVGYDFDVGSHFRLGGVLRASFADYTITEQTGTDVTVFLPALLLTATYDAAK